MVLEVSATPYIFTFKLWDWGRVGLDGIPRPTHVDHGEKVICWDRTTSWVEKNLVNRFEVLSKNECIEERTGLHEKEFIETRRYSFDHSCLFNTNGTLHMFNFVEGEEALIESPTSAFMPFVVHYAETFILPAAVGQFSIKPMGLSLGQKISVLDAYVRS